MFNAALAHQPLEPNSDDWQFEYEPGRHLFTAQLDQRDNRKEYSFDFAGRGD